MHHVCGAQVDYVTDGSRVIAVENGVEMLTLITAAGCSLTALIAAFLVPAQEDPLTATALALSIFGCVPQQCARGHTILTGAPRTAEP